MELTWGHAIILIISGTLVGFINTIAGGGTIISLSVFMFFGLPPNVANGTNRIAILLQNITAVTHFAKKKLIDWPKALRLAIPVIIGSLFGAVIANIIPNTFFSYVFGIVIIIFGILLIAEPNRWLKERRDLIDKPLNFLHYTIFFLIGIYGGFVHVGVGYMILIALVLGTGNELVKANILKNFLVLAYIPFTLVIFAIEGNVNWGFGLVHAIGNIIGAKIGASIALKKGGNFIRYTMIVLIIIVALQLFGIIDPVKIANWLK